MSTFQPGLVHTPVTPFRREGQIDFEAYGRLIEFHLRHGAQALALPTHAGESVSLGDAEQQALLEAALKQVNGRVPIIAHVSDSGTAIAAARAQRAEKTGAAAVIATTPYYWTPPPGMLLEHLAQIGAAVRVPFYVFHSPREMGVKLGTDLILKLIQRLENFAGVVDSSHDWQFMISVISGAQSVRPAFQLVSGTEYMISAGAIGATGMFSPLASVAPKTVAELYARCRKEQYQEARPAQEVLAALRQLVKRAGIAGLKGAMRAMGRDCGQPRPPLDALSAAGYDALAVQLRSVEGLRSEPRGW